MRPEEARTREELVEACGHPKFVFFWGHQRPRGGSISKFCLSQWYDAPFQVAGQRYPTAEHYMMAAKAKLFGDVEVLPRILKAAHPGEAKKLGRRVKSFNEAIWAARSMSIVVEANLHKFGQNEPLAEFLLSTGKRVLVEASPRDRIWGIGLSEEDSDAMHPDRWRGENKLGFALMEVRARLRG